MEIQHNNCHNRTKLDHDIKHLFECRTRLKFNEFVYENQMPGTTDWKPFCDSFHNTKQDYF